MSHLHGPGKLAQRAPSHRSRMPGARFNRRGAGQNSAACQVHRRPGHAPAPRPLDSAHRALGACRDTAAPINIAWGHDNRTVGIRLPIATPQARRLENRVIGADANPYVALAMTLACGYLGIKNKIKPKPEMKGDAYLSPYSLPRSLGEALDWLRRESDLHEVLGREFITVYSEIKEMEFAEFMKVISPWEREHLLLHV